MSLKAILTRGRGTSSQEEHWIPLSDLMTGLMMIFMLVAIVFMIDVQSDAERSKRQAAYAETQARDAERQADLVKSIALIYDRMRAQLYNDLYAEFARDLPSWRAVLLPDLTVRFQEPDVLFDTGRDQLKFAFTAILDDFFPRYMRILNSRKYRDAIEEVRIEGHTSSIWKNATPERAYFENMQLSQARTRSVLEYVLNLPQLTLDQNWLRAHVTANGLSSSKLIMNGGREDIRASQRVEFRVRTNADDKIAEILKAAPQ